MTENRRSETPMHHRRTKKPHLKSTANETAPQVATKIILDDQKAKDEFPPDNFTGKVIWKVGDHEKLVLVVKYLDVDQDDRRAFQVATPQGNLIEGGARAKDLSPYWIAEPGESEPKPLDPGDPRYRSYRFDDSTNKPK